MTSKHLHIAHNPDRLIDKCKYDHLLQTENNTRWKYILTFMDQYDQPF